MINKEMNPPIFSGVYCFNHTKISMDDPHLSSREAIVRLSSFIFIGLLLISLKLIDKYPMLVLGYSIVIFLLGASALIFTSIQLKRLQPIYDYKPIAF